MNLKLEELHTDIAKEVAHLEHNYSSINTKVDSIVGVVTKVVELYSSLLPKVEKKSESNTQSFEKIEELLGNLKELISKLSSLPQSSVSPDSLSTLFSSSDASIKFEMTPFLKLINLMPTDAPPVHTGVQEGARNVGMGLSVGMGSSKSKDGDDAKVVGKVISKQIPTSLPNTRFQQSRLLLQ